MKCVLEMVEKKNDQLESLITSKTIQIDTLNVQIVELKERYEGNENSFTEKIKQL